MPKINGSILFEEVSFSFSDKGKLNLSNLNFEINKGEFVAIVGQSGSGKSTLTKLISRLYDPSNGKICIDKIDISKVELYSLRRQIGIVPQELNLDPFFNPRKLLELQAGLYGVKKKDRITDTILKMVSLDNQADSYSRGLSGGMKRRLMIAKALVHQPPIVILDEPTAGVDVELRKNLWQNVKLLNKNGVSIILTTHYLHEAQEMCDRIGIINKGKLVALDTTKNLLNRIEKKKITLKLSEKIDLKDNELETLKILSLNHKELTLIYDKNRLNIDQILNYVNKKNVRIIDMSTDDGDLEDVFVTLTNN